MKIPLQGNVFAFFSNFWEYNQSIAL